MPVDASHPNQLTLEIKDLALDGTGLAQHDGKLVFVSGALPAETATVRITGQGRGKLHAEISELTCSSPDRRDPVCILAGKCGGCSLLHWQDQAQSQWKQQQLQNTLRRVGRLECLVEPIRSTQAVLGYRNRAIIPVQERDNALKAGFFQRGSHQVVNMNHCPVLDPRLDALIEPLKADLQAAVWPIYNEDTQKGLLRQLVLRAGVSSGELLLGVVVRDDQFQGAQELAEQWMQRWPELVGVVLNVQPKPGNTLLGPKERLLAGRPWLMESFAGRRFQIGLGTFFQVHHQQAEALVDALRSELQLQSGEVLVDAYCGVGTLGLPLIQEGVRLIGIEQSRESIERAQCNALLNGLEDTDFHAGSVERRLQEFLPFTDVLLLDPPRKGLDARVCEAIREQPPARMAYVSCNPATLARDLALLCADQRFELTKVVPFDFFPQTTHIEAMAILTSSAAQL